MKSSQNQTIISIDYRPSLALTGTSSLLSIIGSVFIVRSFWKDKDKSFSVRVLLCLTFADAMNAFGNLLGVIRYAKNGPNLVINEHSSCDSERFCVGQSFITVTASLASFCWTFLAALTHLLNKQRSGYFHLETPCSQIISHIIGWGLPLVIACIAFLEDVLGEGFSSGSGPWCWIKDCDSIPVSPIFWMFFTGKMWEIAAYIGTFAIYMHLKAEKCLKGRKQGEDNQLLKSAEGEVNYSAIHEQEGSINQDSAIDNRFGLLWIFLYFYVTRVWGTIRFFIFVGYNGNPYTPELNNADDFLMYFQSIGDSAQAFVNYLGFILIPFLKNKFSNTSQTGEESLQ